MSQAMPNVNMRLRPQEWWREGGVPDEDLSPAIVDKLVGAGYYTVGDIISAGPLALRKIDGIGNVALEEIKVWLRKLADENDDEAESAATDGKTASAPL